MNMVDIKDPYDTPLFQANLIQQTHALYINTDLDNNIESVKAQVQVEIFLVQGGVEVIYNKNTLHFRDSDNKICFQREINTYLISLGFELTQVLAPLLIYKCATVNIPLSYVVQIEELFLSKSEATVLHEIVLQQLSIR